MNILIHSHLFPNINNPTFGTFVDYYSQSLSSRGHKVYIISPVPYVPNSIPTSHPWSGYRNIPFFTSKNNLDIYHPRFISIPRRKLFFLRGELLYFSAKKFYAQ